MAGEAAVKAAPAVGAQRRALTAVAAGNLTYDRVCTSYSYDGENRVVQSVCGGVTTTYVYDGTGRRVKKTTGVNSTIYIFAGNTVIAEKSGGQWKDYLYSGSAFRSTSFTSSLFGRIGTAYEPRQIQLALKLLF